MEQEENINCKDTYNSKNCKNCISARDCEDCSYIDNCDKCKNCSHCGDSVNLNNCKGIQDGHTLTNCDVCSRCSSCKDSDNLYECHDCENCSFCEHSRNLNNCKNCEQCNNMSYCENCYSCSNFHGTKEKPIKYMLRNEQLDKEEYDLQLEELKNGLVRTKLQNTKESDEKEYSHTKIISKIRKHLEFLNKIDVIKFEIDDNYKVSVNVICEQCKQETIKGDAGFYCDCDIEKRLQKGIENVFEGYKIDNSDNIKMDESCLIAMKGIEHYKKYCS